MVILKKYFFPYFELAVWAGGLIGLACTHLAAEGHLSLCFFKWIGVSFCPGCGLGHSISWLLHGDIKQSLQAHPLGFFAAVVLIHRIYILIKRFFIYSTTLKQ